MKKKITLVLIFLIICFSLGSYLVISNSNTSKKIKRFIPNNIKLLLKETIFIIPKLKKDNYEILEKLKLLDRDLAILKANNKKMLGVKIFDDPLKSKPYPNNTKGAKGAKGLQTAGKAAQNSKLGQNMANLADKGKEMKETLDTAKDSPMGQAMSSLQASAAQNAQDTARMEDESRQRMMSGASTGSTTTRN